MITDIKDLANVKVGEVVNIAINVNSLEGNVVPIIGTIKCKIYNPFSSSCKQCVFNNTMDCAYNEICCFMGRLDKKSVYFELIESSDIKE